jgi:alpha-D-xyloside xylohydrolase
MIAMPRRHLSLYFLACISLFLFSFRETDADPVIKTKDGIVVHPDPNFSGNTRVVKLQVISDNIIRIMAGPENELPFKKSFITSYAPDPAVKWEVTNDKENAFVKTNSITARVHLKTGAVSFTDNRGNKILAEKIFNGRSFKPAVFEGKPSHSIAQTFIVNNDDALYGLGQHQDDLFNYRGYQVSLFQNNTEVAVPFLISNKPYGILWDNYSITAVGDTRTYRPLSALQLYAKDGTPGWLTASYSNDKKNPSEVAVARAESTISMEFLNDSKLQLPKEFTPATGVVNWEGSIASGISGNHTFRFTYGGYIKVWVDNKLIVDRWRQAWMPGSAIVNLSLDKGKKYPIRIEWIPAGGESYISAKWLEPQPESEKNQYSFSSEAGQMLDYYFINGRNMDEVIAGYRALTGKAVLMPKWAFGKWQSRERYKTVDEILNTVKEFRERKIPLDNIVLDWSYWKENAWGSQEFDSTRFPNPDSMIQVLHKEYNTKFMISVWPKFYEGIPAYKKFDKNGWLYKRNIADRQRDWIGQGYVSTFYDVFNEDAQKGFWDLLNKKLYSKGVDAWWMDASEPDILSNVSPEKRKGQMVGLAAGTAAENLNAYPLLNAKGIYEGQRSANPDDRVLILTRSGFAGSQRYAAVIWSGDVAARWHDMKAQVSAGINFSMSGIPYWTMDIGGFAVEPRFEKPNAEDLEEWREQMTRWYQYGAFCPMFRVHGQFPYREIFNTAPEDHPAYQSMLYYDKLRYRLLPYIYSIAAETYHTNGTMMRGLVMDFPADKNVHNIGDQYLFGPALLINPVYTYEATSRRVYLPRGTNWYDIYTGKCVKGGETITAAAPYERMPLFVKEGSIIPFGPELQYTSEKPADTLSLFVYTGKDARFTLYEDEGTNYNYEKGLFSSISITYNQSAGILTIGDRKGSFPGMLQNRVFKITWIKPAEPKPLDLEQQADKEIKYNGKAVTINMNRSF